MNWNFVVYILRRLGFCENWVGWIKKFLESTYIQVLDNGFPMMEFAPQRGLRQGDPFAPFMFTIVMEGLSGMMREVVKKNMFEGLFIGKNGVMVDLLQYVDDTIFFAKASDGNVMVIKSML